MLWDQREARVGRGLSLDRSTVGWAEDWDRISLRVGAGWAHRKC